MVRPDFLVIGAMKSMTSSLHDQLAALPELNLSSLKEPCFFSNDEQFQRGWDWYASCWSNPNHPGMLGESSTHYAKLPTYPKTVERIVEHCPDVRIIYVIRHPIDRLISQYIHEWTVGKIRQSFELAVRRFSILTDYSRYAFQLKPYLQNFDRQQILVVSFDALRIAPTPTLRSILRFLDVDRPVDWQTDLAPCNISSHRMRKSVIRDRIVNAPGVRWARKTLVPPSVRDSIKSLWQIRNRPELSNDLRSELEKRFDDDLGQLSTLLQLPRPLSCEGFGEFSTWSGCHKSLHDECTTVGVSARNLQETQAGELS